MGRILLFLIWKKDEILTENNIKPTSVDKSYFDYIVEVIQETKLKLGNITNIGSFKAKTHSGL